jgi:hypothetical protein
MQKQFVNGLKCRRQRAADADEFHAPDRDLFIQTNQQGHVGLMASEAGSNGRDDSSSQDR